MLCWNFVRALTRPARTSVSGTGRTWKGRHNSPAWVPGIGKMIVQVARSMLKNRKTIRIDWGDCDPAGIIFFPRYFSYFDACTHALLEHAGCRQRDMQSAYGI